jgi:hypothetical protein
MMAGSSTWQGGNEQDPDGWGDRPGRVTIPRMVFSGAAKTD